MFKRSNLLYCAAALVILGCVSASPAFAAEDYLDLLPEELLNVEVTSVSKRPEKLSETPAAAYIITRDDILRAGVATIPDALRLAPGVEVAQQDANSWSVSIRGMNNGLLANKLLVMIDGRTVYNPLFAGVYWEAQDVLFEDIDRIEVIRGPGGTLWGANAVNGVINIITRHSRETIGNLAAGSFGMHQKPVIGLRHGGILGPDQTYRVYAKAFQRDHFTQPDGDPAADEWESGRGGFRMDWNNSFTLQGDAYRTDTEYRSSLLTLDPPFSATRDLTVKSTGANLLGRWKKDYASGAALNIQSYLDYTERDEPMFLKDERLILDLETQYNLEQIGRHSIIVGAGYRYLNEEEKGTRSVIITPANQSDSLFSAFMQDKITLVPDQWYLTLGSKFEHNEYSGVEIQPNARLQWHPDSEQTLWAAVSRAVRTPTRLERDTRLRLRTGPGPTQVALLPSPEFDSENLVAYEIGYRNQITPDISVDAATFYNDYDDLASISAGTPFIDVNGIDPPNLLTPVTANNGIKAESYGFELFAGWDVSDSWSLSGTYSFIDLQMHEKSAGVINAAGSEDSDPHHQVSLRSSWQIKPDLSLDTTAWYIDQTNQNNIKDYVRLDLNLGWQIDDNVKFNLVGQNLLDDRHREQGDPNGIRATEIERTVFGKLTWQF